MSDTADRSDRRVHALGSYSGAAPEIGQWLWAMEETRRGLLSTLSRIEKAGFGQEFLDWQGADGKDNSLGTLLYHIAGVEMGWLYVDMLMTGFPADVQERFPVDDHTDDGRMRYITGLALQDHLDNLAWTRRRFLDVVGALSVEEWNELKSPPNEDYSITPGWIVFHLVEHEAGHLYEIRRLVRKWREKRA